MKKQIYLRQMILNYNRQNFFISKWVIKLGSESNERRNSKEPGSIGGKQGEKLKIFS